MLADERRTEPSGGHQGAMSILRMNGISKRTRNQEILNSASIDIKSGEVVGLVGHNGAGKSTLMRIAAGLTSATSGSCCVDGRLALLPEQPVFIENASGFANLKALGALRARPTSGEIRQLLERVGLATAGKKVVRKYSQGMRQRLGIAQALMEKADIVILDEPSNGLDPSGMKWLREVIEVESRRGAGILVSSHLLDELEKMCDRVVLLHGGAIVAEWLAKDTEPHVTQVASTDFPSLKKACSHFGWAVETQEGLETVRVQTGLPTEEVVRRLVLAGVPIRGVQEVKATLDDVLERRGEARHQIPVTGG